MDVETLLTTTRSVRRKLDFDRPVAIDLLKDCLRVAQQAPAAGNLLDAAHWVVVTDPALRAPIARIVREDAIATMKRYEHLVDPSAFTSARYLVDNLERVPALVLPCLTGRPPEGHIEQSAYYGSSYPAIWSFQLALRAKGLGSSMCAYHLAEHEAEVAGLLGIPADVTQISLLAVAYTTQREFRPGKRPPLERIAHFNGWAA